MKGKMREIKFRFWDTKEDKMSTDPDLGLTMGGDPVYLDWGGGVSVEKNLIPLQYTGLKDKNGVEIYEGDILEGKESKDYGVVIYMSPQFVVDPVSDHKMNTLGDGRVGITELNYSQVIGNIYQNPELLAPSQGEKE